MFHTDQLRLQLDDATLCGNDAAEDEEDVVFQSYAVQRPEVISFLNASKSICIAKAYKGEGKSALLRLVAMKLASYEDLSLVVFIPATQISPDLQTTDPDEWVRAWKKAILKQAACEIGNNISFAFKDDGISLVEEAERYGFRQRSFVSSLTERLRSEAVPIERRQVDNVNHEKVLQRWLNKGSLVWFLIDDLDYNFENNLKYKVKISSFFTAIRHICNLIPEFRFRATIRPNVWALVKEEHESLSHVEQYLVSLKWSAADYYELIARRVEGYLKRKDLWKKVEGLLSGDNNSKNRQLISFVFDDPMPWGRRNRSPVTVLYTLSQYRPRWLVELWRVSANAAVVCGNQKISFGNIDGELKSFGDRRIQDTIAEFKSQCPEVKELIVSFVDQPEGFSTDELMKLITSRILQSVSPNITGVWGKPTNIDVAKFLYQIGFLTARKTEENGEYHHVLFAESPTLLDARTNLDQGYSWEIHPVFRQPLRLKNVVRK